MTRAQFILSLIEGGLAVECLHEHGPWTWFAMFVAFALFGMLLVYSLPWEIDPAAPE